MKSGGVFKDVNVGKKSTGASRKIVALADVAKERDAASLDAQRRRKQSVRLQDLMPGLDDPDEARRHKARMEEVRKEFDGGEAAWPENDVLTSKFYSETLIKILQFQRLKDFEDRFIELMKSVAKEAIDGTSLDQNLPDAIESLLKSHFHRAHELKKPEIPTIKYRPRTDKIIPFLYLVWSEWIASGHFTKQVLRQNDRPAYTALQNWLRHNEMPTVIAARNYWELNDEFVQREWFHRDEVPRAAGALYRRTPED